MKEEIIIYVISDSIGETGELIASASVRQFISEGYRIKKYSYVESREQIEKIFQEAILGKSMIIYTTVLEETRDYIERRGKDLDIPTIDVMTPPMSALEDLLKIKPKRESGIIRRLDDDYFKQVKAVEFAIKYDDGKDPRGIKESDICLIGISRTSKTPLSMYLAHKNFKVANLPLLPEVKPPKELFEKDSRRIIGLIVNTDILNEIRLDRLRSLGLDSKSDYASIERIERELDYSKKLMEELGCIIIDVSNKALGDTSNIIIDHMTREFGQDAFL